ncbi:phosphopantetheine-binding protein [Nocardia gipuzkoensis]
MQDNTDGGSDARVELIDSLVRSALACDLEKIGFDENLIAQGLDSIQVMKISGQLRSRGIKVGFAALMAEPTLLAWRRLSGAA